MDYTVGGHTYKVGKLDVFEQFHIARKLGPILGDVAVALESGEGGDRVLQAIPAVVTGFAKPSNDDMDFCLLGLLRAVERQQPNGLGWGPVVIPNTRKLAYDDIELPQMLQLAWHSLSQNMHGFFAGLPADFRAVLQKPSGPSPG